MLLLRYLLFFDIHESVSQARFLVCYYIMLQSFLAGLGPRVSSIMQALCNEFCQLPTLPREEDKH